MKRSDLLTLKKSSKILIKDKGSRKTKLFWLKTIANKKFIEIKEIPPPLGFIWLWALLWFGKSGISFVKGFINNLVNNQLSEALIKRIKNIFKIIILW